MAVNPIELLRQIPAGGVAGVERTGTRQMTGTPSFGETLKRFISEVNDLQLEANQQMKLMAAGQAENLHDVMIAVEKASISFELLMEIRNKVLEAYQELMRMQV